MFSLMELLIGLFVIVAVVLGIIYFFYRIPLKTVAAILVALAAIVYISIGGLLYLNQKSLVYSPGQQSFRDCPGFSDYKKVSYQGTRMYFKENPESEGVVIYYHGRPLSACNVSLYKRTFEKTNYSLIFAEYAGYSSDDQETSRELILQDVKNIREFIEEKGFKDTVVFGRSIGSGPASYQASFGDVDNLILVSPFSTMIDAAQVEFPITKYYPLSFMIKEKYDNISWLKNYQGKLTVIEGENDYVTPPQLARKLYEAVPTRNKEYKLLEGVGHIWVWSSATFRKAVFEALQASKK